MTRPSERRIGARIHIRAEHVAAALALFAGGSFQPLYLDEFEGGSVSFWFDKATVKVPAFIETVQGFPLQYWAKIGIVGSPVFH